MPLNQAYFQPGEDLNKLSEQPPKHLPLALNPKDSYKHNAIKKYKNELNSKIDELNSKQGSTQSCEFSINDDMTILKVGDTSVNIKIAFDGIHCFQRVSGTVEKLFKNQSMINLIYDECERSKAKSK